MYLLRFVLKHLVAGTALTMGMILASAVLYFVLLAIALVFGLGIGGPLALPFMMLLGGAAGLAGTLAALLPATVLAESLRRKLRLPWLCEIPLASALSLLVALAFAWYTSNGAPPRTFVPTVLCGWLALALPLGLYWWTMQAVDAFVRVNLRTARLLASTLARALPWV